jgi:hypothetical protein
MKTLFAALLVGAVSFVAVPAYAADDAKKAENSQQNRMKECNTKAKGMKGDEHKKFMSECLKG